MVCQYVDLPGLSINPKELRFPRSISLSHFLASRIDPHAELIDIRKNTEGNEIIVFDVEVEVSQVRAFDIHPRERLAVVFREHEELNPEVLVLRKDFPYVPHLNPRDEEIPRSICLYEESFDELKLRWTPASFVERTRWWLSETAKGTLHGEDQPLEPILLGDFPPLVLPSGFLASLASTGTAQPLDIERRLAGSREVYVAGPGIPATGFAAIAFVAQPHLHGAIRLHPRNLIRLNQILKNVGLDLIDEFRQRLGQWNLSDRLLNAPPIIVVVLPKERRAGAGVETTELWAFLLSKTIGDLGVALGVLQRHGASFGRVLSGQPDERLIEETTVFVLNPTFSLSRSGAAMLNGTEPNTLKIAAIGLGSLGSQVTNNLARAGFGIWTGIDDDFVLPHNAARHQLGQYEIGRLKVQGMQMHLNGVLDEDAMPRVLDANVLRPGSKETELAEVFSNTDTILDFSASLAVARKLVSFPENQIRRCSVFLNPSGTDLVILCEDKDRKVRLDWLEFQYYRELVSNAGLTLHFQREEGRIRYARSCRDLTSQVPQHFVATHAGIASRALQDFLPQAEAVVRVWHADSLMNVQAHQVATSPVIDLKIGGWRVCTDQVFLEKVEKCRKTKLPNETGGVLIGSFDQENRIAYLVDIIPSPPDSVEWPILYIRGCGGLEGEVTRIRARTDDQLQYVGEWHSHPDGCNTEPSEDDKKVFGWLAENAARDSNPPVMVIVGQKETRIFFASIEASVLLKRKKWRN